MALSLDVRVENRWGIMPLAARAAAELSSGASLTIRQVFDPRLNALNVVRLLMAVGVIFWHSFPLTGTDIAFDPLRQFVAEVWVDGFFAVSGFLITASWMRRPEVREYLLARAIRIIPGFYVCLLITAFVVAPIGVAMQGGSAIRLLLSPPRSSTWGRILASGSSNEESATPLPACRTRAPGNGSLWTLGWEVLCYLGVMALGVAGLLKHQWCLPSAFAASWLLLLATHVTGMDGHPAAAARFSIMFLAGALVFQYQDRLRCTWPMVAMACAVTLASMWLPDYRFVGAVFWSYAVISVGALVKSKHLVMRNDISYGVYIYAFPVQQLLYLGVGAINQALFSVIAMALTIPLAAASWFVIEKPAKRLRGILGSQLPAQGRTAESEAVSAAPARPR
ncbi:acyltransferase family protein [Rhodococcus hoagii]|nr:acyltransferase family protein [Prescottella equi]